ncbi:hypothetical protein [Actinacidiphila acidipaludis]|uniref:hypothetical protein n=1 Tax=Actinacidiphila acidipaludis TaxID=2873382 RepID=UPI0027E20664|nr:hypothetical protein [Streptomyces acidipaludis]
MTASGVLAVLACVLVPLALIAVWVHDIALDTDRYVATMAPLARNRAIQDAAVVRIARAVDVRVNGPAATAQLAAWLRSHGLPPQAAQAVQNLGPQLDTAVDDAVRKAATRVVRSDRFPRVWDQANRRAHTAIVQVLTGQGRGAVDVRDGTVVLEVGTAVDTLKKQLEDEGLAPAKAIPSTDKELVLFSSDQLGKIRTFAHVLDVVGNWIIPAVVVIAAAGVLLARRRRRALARVALGAAVACLIVAILLSVARGYYLDHLPAQVQSRDAAAAVFDTLVRFLRQALRTAIALGVVLALGAYLVGPGRLPVAVRGGCEHAADSVARWADRHQVRTGRAGTWTLHHRRWLTLGAVIAVAIGFAAWNTPTALVILGLVLILLALLTVIALLAAGGRVTDAADRPAA